jgi:hypothetical protein
MADPTLDEAVDDDSFLLADGFEEAFIGMARRIGGGEVAVYDYDECVAVLMRRDKMTYEEALDYFEYNVVGAFMGPKTPLFVELKTLPEVLEERA